MASNELEARCAVLAHRFPFAAERNSQARQQAADRAWTAISRFYAACRAKTPGRKGYPRFQRHCRSVEYKVTGWTLEAGGKHIRFSIGNGIGRLRLLGTRSIETYPVEWIKQVRLVRRADGYSVQFCVQADRRITHAPTARQLASTWDARRFSPIRRDRASPSRVICATRNRTSSGCIVSSRVKRRDRRTGTKPGSGRPKRICTPNGRVRTRAGTHIASSDGMAVEDLPIRNLLRNRHLAKSISDAAWARYFWWVEDSARLHGIMAVAVPPRWTSQDCSGCGHQVRKSLLAVRTHRCPHGGLLLDRDHTAARTILHASYTLNRSAG
jgi:putative transposase